MEVWMILHKLRNGSRLGNFGNNFKEFQRIMSVLSRAGLFIGQILTREQGYAGLITKLELSDGQVGFTIIDCDADGRTNSDSKTYQEKIPWEDLKDIQVLRNKKGKLLSLDDLLRDHKIEEKNE